MTDSFSSVFDALLGALSVAPGFRDGDLFYVALLNKITLQIEFPWIARKEGNHLVRIQDETHWMAHSFDPQTLLPDYILQDGKPVFISDGSLATAVTHEKLTFSEPPTHACWLGVPLESRGEVLGALIVEYQPQATVHNERIQDFLAAITGRVAGQIAAERLVKRLRDVNDVGKKLTSATHRLTEQEVVELIVEQTKQFLNADSMYVALYDDELKRLTFPVAVEGGKREVFEPRIVNIEDQTSGGLTEVVIRTKEPLCPRNVEEEYERRNLAVRIPPLPKSWLGVPMLLEDRVLGVISLRNDAIPYLYSEDDKYALQAMAGQAAIAIDNARLFYDVNQRLVDTNKRLEALIEVGQKLGSGIQLPLDDLLQLVYQQAGRLMDTSNMYVALYDRETQTLSFPLAVYRGQRQTDWPSRQADIRDESRGGLTEIVLRTGKSLRPDDVEAEYRAGNLEVPVPPIPKSWLGVPMRSGNKILGVIALQDDETEGAYTAEAQAVLEVMAAQAASVIENASLYDAQVKWANQLKGLQKIAVDISSNLELNSLLGLIAANVNTVTSADFSTLFACNSETGVFEVGVRRGKIDKEPDLPSQSGFAETIVRSQEPRFLVDAHLDAAVKAAVLDEKKVRSFAAVPLICKEKTVGVLFVNFLQRHEFTALERDLLHLLANQAAVAIENARLYEQLNKRVTELKTAQDQIANRERTLVTTMFAVDTIHTINNLAGPIVPWVDLIREALREKGHLSEDIANYLGRIEKDADRILHETHMLGQELRNPTDRDDDVDLVEMIRSIVGQVEVMMSPDIAITFKSDKILPKVRANRRQLSTAIYSVVENAQKAIEARSGPGTISIKLIQDSHNERSQSYLRVVISDDGCGIPSQQREFVFEPGESLWPDHKGMRYGLWRARSILRDMGGDLILSLTEPGKGSSFELLCPVVEASIKQA